MTKDKAIEEVKNYENYPHGLSKECRDYIIKALEQEPILDKIRAEIEQDAIKSVFGTKYIFVNRVNQIIDKYKAEGEKV